MVLNKGTWLTLVHNMIKLLLKILDKFFFLLVKIFYKH